MSIASEGGCEVQKEAYTETCLWTSARDRQNQRVYNKTSHCFDPFNASLCLKPVTYVSFQYNVCLS